MAPLGDAIGQQAPRLTAPMTLASGSPPGYEPAGWRPGRSRWVPECAAEQGFLESAIPARPTRFRAVPRLM